MHSLWEQAKSNDQALAFSSAEVMRRIFPKKPESRPVPPEGQACQKHEDSRFKGDTERRRGSRQVNRGSKGKGELRDY